MLHHKDVFVSQSKIEWDDRWFFSRVNRESWGVLEYAGVLGIKMGYLGIYIHFDAGIRVESFSLK